MEQGIVGGCRSSDSGRVQGQECTRLARSHGQCPEVKTFERKKWETVLIDLTGVP